MKVLKVIALYLENWPKSLKRMTQWETYEREGGRDTPFNADFFFFSLA